jgi:enamine deaminase RidA (YjgF/YER057c/UK114 family)
MGVPPPRSSMATMGFTVPGAQFATNVIFLVPDAEHVKEETRAGIRWHPVDVRKVNFSPGIKAGPWLFTAGQVPVPDFAKAEWVGSPAGLPHHFSDIEIQTEFTLQLLREQLQANGHSLADVVDARIYLVDVHRDFRGFARAWQRAFVGVEQSPTMSMMPSNQADGDTGIMFPGPLVEIDLISRHEA